MRAINIQMDHRILLSNNEYYEYDNEYDEYDDEFIEYSYNDTLTFTQMYIKSFIKYITSYFY